MKTAPQLPGSAGRAWAAGCAETGAAEPGPAEPEPAAPGPAAWNGSMVRGLAALEFLERSSDMASEAVIAMPVRLGR